VSDPAPTQDPSAKPSLVDRLKARYQALRDRSALMDHLARTFEHYTASQASTLSGAATYFGLLSFFPIVALVYAILGFVVSRFPEAQEPVLDAMQNVLPGLFDQLDTEQIADAAARASILGILGFLYSGLGWLSSLRRALQTIFAVPKGQRGNMIIGKVTDLIVLCALGAVLLVSVASSSLVTTLTSDLLDALGINDVPGMEFSARTVGIVIGILSSTLLFYVLFRLLGRPRLPVRALAEGALLAAIGFELLKLLATFVIGNTLGNPIYGPFALVIALLVWISFFARLTLLGASWAATTPAAGEVVATRMAREAEQALVALRPEVVADHAPDVAGDPLPKRDRGALLAGAALGAAAVGLAVVLRKTADPTDG